MNMHISRRTMLRGLGTAIALPALEAMMPRTVMGAVTAGAAAAGPKRLAWVYVPNGIHMPDWTPEAVGAGYQLTPTLKHLEAFKDKMTVISGLVCDKANANGDGPGDHARSMASYLTGVQARKTEGASIHLGVSVDQAAASRIGHLTKFPSLELGIEEGKQVGRCDSGYSCAYSHNLSWRNETTPLVKDCNPQSVFDRLFANGDPNESAEARARREARKKSVLDYILDDASGLQRNLGATDKRKVDEYLAAIRDIELRLNRTAQGPEIAPPQGAERPAEAAKREFPDHCRLMLDMMVLAFQTDLTRVITFPFADEGSNQTYPWCDANVPHHGTSHHQGDPAKQELLAKINVFHIKHLAYLLEKLDKIQEGNGSILDNSLIVYGSGNSDGQRHNHDDLPLILLGKGGGTVKTGRHVNCQDVPLNNLWLSLLDRVGAPTDKLGDSTGKIDLS